MSDIISPFVRRIKLDIHLGLLRAHPPPHRRGYRIRVAGGQQHLRLIGLQHPRGLVSAWPPHKAPFRQPLLRQPEPLPVIDQDADRRPSPAPEHKQTTRERIRLQFLLAQSGKRVDALSSIHGFDRHQDAHLRRNLDHARSHNYRLSPARSGAVVPFHWIRILLPAEDSNSITHFPTVAVAGCAEISSTNAGAAVFAIGLADCTLRLSLPYSKRKTFAVWKTPCSRATSAADAHSGSGIGKRAPLCSLRQRSKRR